MILLLVSCQHPKGAAWLGCTHDEHERVSGDVKEDVMNRREGEAREDVCLTSKCRDQVEIVRLDRLAEAMKVEELVRL